jgi:hypothetical protein
MRHNNVPKDSSCCSQGSLPIGVAPWPVLRFLQLFHSRCLSSGAKSVCSQYINRILAIESQDREENAMFIFGNSATVLARTISMGSTLVIVLAGLRFMCSPMPTAISRNSMSHALRTSCPCRLIRGLSSRPSTFTVSNITKPDEAWGTCWTSLQLQTGVEY